MSRRAGARGGAALTVLALAALTACGAPPPKLPEPSITSTSATTATQPTETGPIVVVTLPPIGEDRPTATQAAETTGTEATDRVVTVNLDRCPDCTVASVATDVRPQIDAALAVSERGAMLLSVTPGGDVLGAMKVPYGLRFADHADDALPCDAAGRCFVMAEADGGAAVVSSFELGADGSWRDVTAAGAFRSATPTAAVADVNGDGPLEIAVQAERKDGPLWVVHSWDDSAGRFTVLGCAAAGADEVAPVADELSIDTCSD